MHCIRQWQNRKEIETAPGSQKTRTIESQQAYSEKYHYREAVCLPYS